MRNLWVVIPGLSLISWVLAHMDGTHDLLRTIESRTTAMTIEEVGELFNVSPETIRRMAVRKKIGGAFKFGGSWRFNPASLGYWLRQRDPLAAKANKALASDSRQTAVVN
jgi:excisionase family DNA binding protein